MLAANKKNQKMKSAATISFQKIVVKKYSKTWSMQSTITQNLAIIQILV
jgi:hypothetical protein